MRTIIAATELPIDKSYCIYTMPESKFVPSLWLMIAWQAVLIALCWLLPLAQSCCKKASKSMSYLCVLSDSHKELVEGGEKRNFYKHLKSATIVLVALLVCMTASVVVILKGVTFEE